MRRRGVRERTRVGARLRIRMPPALAGALLAAVTITGAAASPRFDPKCRVQSVVFGANGKSTPLGSLRRGDHVRVTFVVPAGCVDRLTFASFRAPPPAFDGSRLSQQVLISKDTGVFREGQHSLEVDVFGSPDECSATPTFAPLAEPNIPPKMKTGLRRLMRTSPEFRERMREAVRAKVTAGHGANQSGPYDSTCDGSPSQNGNGDGRAVGEPCAGCVGNADEKNPLGQVSNGPDAGYECDDNHGVGRGNPAHSGCQNFQVDFSYGPQVDDLTGAQAYGPGLIAAVFCDTSIPVCYVTDHTS